MQNTLRRFFAENAEMLSVFRHFFIGFSGGIDSTALVLALHEAGVSFTAVHFEHHIRGEEADADAQWCRNFCQTRGIAFQRVDLDVPGQCRPGESMEAAARRLRLEGWETLAAGRPCAVFLAHHADDCMENLFLRLARGSNVSGLLGMASMKKMGNLLLCRPFLQVRKEKLQNYLEMNGITDWRIDSTNGDNDYRRNAIRNELLPLWRAIFGNDHGLLRSLEVLRLDADCLEESAETFFDQQLAGDSPSLDAWRLPGALFQRVFRKWLAAKTGHGDAPVSYATIERLHTEIESLESASGTMLQKKIIPIGNGIRLALSKAHGMELVREATALTAQTWNFRDTPQVEVPEANAAFCVCWNSVPMPSGYYECQAFDAAAFGGNFSVLLRGRCAGDMMQPFGSTQKVRLQNLMINAKYPAELRNRVPIVVHQDQIIWVPGIRRAEFGRITEATKEKIVFGVRLLKEK